LELAHNNPGVGRREKDSKTISLIWKNRYAEAEYRPFSAGDYRSTKVDDIAVLASGAGPISDILAYGPCTI
jgi:hypothetical protein